MFLFFSGISMDWFLWSFGNLFLQVRTRDTAPELTWLASSTFRNKTWVIWDHQPTYGWTRNMRHQHPRTGYMICFHCTFQETPDVFHRSPQSFGNSSNQSLRGTHSTSSMRPGKCHHWGPKQIGHVPTPGSRKDQAKHVVWPLNMIYIVLPRASQGQFLRLVAILGKYRFY